MNLGVTQEFLAGSTSSYFARLDNYPQVSEKSGYDLNSEIDLLWGDFQNPFLSDDLMP